MQEERAQEWNNYTKSNTSREANTTLIQNTSRVAPTTEAPVVMHVHTHLSQKTHEGFTEENPP